jgi:hypothetical protein
LADGCARRKRRQLIGVENRPAIFGRLCGDDPTICVICARCARRVLRDNLDIGSLTSADIRGKSGRGR